MEFLNSCHSFSFVTVTKKKSNLGMPMPENWFVILLLCESFCFEKLILDKLNENLVNQQAYCIQFEDSILLDFSFFDLIIHIVTKTLVFGFYVFKS